MGATVVGKVTAGVIDLVARLEEARCSPAKPGAQSVLNISRFAEDPELTSRKSRHPKNWRMRLSKRSAYGPAVSQKSSAESVSSIISRSS